MRDRSDAGRERRPARHSNDPTAHLPAPSCPASDRVAVPSPAAFRISTGVQSPRGIFRSRAVAGTRNTDPGPVVLRHAWASSTVECTANIAPTNSSSSHGHAAKSSALAADTAHPPTDRSDPKTPPLRTCAWHLPPRLSWSREPVEAPTGPLLHSSVAQRAVPIPESPALARARTPLE